jgi:hypothetical protein
MRTNVRCAYDGTRWVALPVELQAHDPEALSRRVEAAIGLVRAREVDPPLALSYVVWPSSRLAEASAQGARPQAQRLADALELVAEGTGQAKAAEQLGLYRWLIQEALRENDLPLRLPV